MQSIILAYCCSREAARRSYVAFGEFGALVFSFLLLLPFLAGGEGGKRPGHGAEGRGLNVLVLDVHRSHGKTFCSVNISQILALRVSSANKTMHIGDGGGGGLPLFVGGGGKLRPVASYRKKDGC